MIINTEWISQFIAEHQLTRGFAALAQQYYLPIAQQLLEHQKSAKQTFYVGINGCQGSGKSSMTAFLQQALESMAGLKVVSLSLDDFYLSQQERSALAVKVHPLFKTRGVPGTHHTHLLHNTLQRLGQNAQTPIPRFDKATDNPKPVDQWLPEQGPVDIVLMEGWCWGVPAQSNAELQSPVNTLEAEQDSLQVWRHFVNQRLRENYQPLYDVMNYWIMLKAPSFDCVYRWRLEQEQKLAAKAAEGANTGVMSDAQIRDFIQYYQRLTEHGLTQLPQYCDVVLSLDENRQLVDAKGVDAGAADV